MDVQQQKINQNSQQQKGPKSSYRSGQIQVTIWENTDKGGNVNLSIKLIKQYKDQQGNWRETNTFFPQELPKVKALLEAAYHEITVTRVGGD